MISKDWVFNDCLILFICLKAHTQTDKNLKFFPRVFKANSLFLLLKAEALVTAQRKSKPQHSLGEIRYDFVVGLANHTHEKRERLIVKVTHCLDVVPQVRLQGHQQILDHSQSNACSQTRGWNDPFAIFFALNTVEDSYIRLSCSECGTHLYCSMISFWCPTTSHCLVGQLPKAPYNSLERCIEKQRFMFVSVTWQKALS